MDIIKNNKKIKHIFLTGEKQVGKSTVIRRVLEELKLQPAGLWTVPYCENGKFAGYKIEGRKTDGEKTDGKKCGGENRISHVMEDGSVFPVVPAFETTGVKILKEAMTDTSLVVMDELGRFETKAWKFRETVIECLNRNIHVIGVVQDTKTDFLDSIREREDVWMIRVTKENREEVFEKMHSYMERNFHLSGDEKR